MKAPFADFERLFELDQDGLNSLKRVLGFEAGFLERKALLGDAVLNKAVISCLLEKHPSKSVGEIDAIRQRCVTNSSQARFIGPLVPTAVNEPPWSDHRLGTVFEAWVADWIDPQKEKAFAQCWIDWVKENISETDAGVETTSPLQMSVRNTEKMLQSLEPLTELDPNVLRAFQNLKEKVMDSVKVRLLLSLDDLHECQHWRKGGGGCGQRRCIIFRCSSKLPCSICNAGTVCGIVVRACYACRHEVDVETGKAVADRIPKGHRRPSPSDLFEEIPSHQHKGLPLSCPKCAFECGVLNHCSRAMRCKLGGCSNRNPCKRYTVWKCLECGETRLMTRK